MDFDKDKLKDISAGFKSNVGAEGTRGFIDKVKGIFSGREESPDELYQKALKARKEKIAMK